MPFTSIRTTTAASARDNYMTRELPFAIVGLSSNINRLLKQSIAPNPRQWILHGSASEQGVDRCTASSCMVPQSSQISPNFPYAVDLPYDPKVTHFPTNRISRIPFRSLLRRIIFCFCSQPLTRFPRHRSTRLHFFFEKSVQRACSP